jgi:hypothetical protein
MPKLGRDRFIWVPELARMDHGFPLPPQTQANLA